MKIIKKYESYRNISLPNKDYMPFSVMIDELEANENNKVDISDERIIRTINKYYGHNSFEMIKERWDFMRKSLDSIDKVYIEDKFLEVMEYDIRLTSHLSFGTTYHRIYDKDKTKYICYFSHDNFNMFLNSVIEGTLSRSISKPNDHDYIIDDRYTSMDQVCNLFKPAISLSISNRKNREVKIDVSKIYSVIEPLLPQITDSIPYDTILQVTKPTNDSIFGNMADWYTTKIILDI